MQFKILKIEGIDTTVEFTFDDGTTYNEKISLLPVNDEAALAKFLTDYGTAYLAGKEWEKAQAALQPASGLIGKTFDAVVPVAPVEVAPDTNEPASNVMAETSATAPEVAPIVEPITEPQPEVAPEVSPESPTI